MQNQALRERSSLITRGGAFSSAEKLYGLPWDASSVGFRISVWTIVLTDISGSFRIPYSGSDVFA